MKTFYSLSISSIVILPVATTVAGSGFMIFLFLHLFNNKKIILNINSNASTILKTLTPINKPKIQIKKIK